MGIVWSSTCAKAYSVLYCRTLLFCNVCRYGDLSNTQLLHSYGFVEPSSSPHGPNPHNVVHVLDSDVVDRARIEGLCDESGDLEDRLERLRRGGVLLPQYDVTAAELVPEKLLTAIQVLHMEDAEFREYAQSDNMEAGATAADGGSSVSNSASKKPSVSPSAAAAPLMILGSDYHDGSEWAVSVNSTLLGLVGHIVERQTNHLTKIKVDCNGGEDAEGSGSGGGGGGGGGSSGGSGSEATSKRRKGSSIRGSGRDQMIHEQRRGLACLLHEEEIVLLGAMKVRFVDNSLNLGRPQLVDLQTIVHGMV